MVAAAKKAEPVLVTGWYPGDTHPVREGLYERNFIDGVFKQWWDGAHWYGWHNGRAHDKPHWRQASSYVTWRGRRMWVLVRRADPPVSWIDWALVDDYLISARPRIAKFGDLSSARPFKTERAAQRFAARYSHLGLTAVLP